MNQAIQDYNNSQEETDRSVCDRLTEVINSNLKFTEAKLWHGHPVWFIEGNPIVGFSKQKSGIRLMFWSGVSFEEDKLAPSDSGKFKDASIFYNEVSEIDAEDLMRWLKKSEEIQWDYKNIVRRKGVLERLK